MMNQRKDADVIVIGAGIAGLTTAIALAKSSIKTIVLEKSKRHGSAAFHSGVISKNFLEELFGSCDVPFERKLNEVRSYLLEDKSFLSFNQKKESIESFIVLRSKLNMSLSSMLESSGGKIVYENVVRDLIIEGEKVIGLKTDEKDFFSDVVVIAEGVNSQVTKKAGLRKGEISPSEVILFVEENISLSKDNLEERFSIDGDLGVAIKLSTRFENLNALQGLGYLYTNKDSVTLGSGILLSESISKGININEFQEKIKEHIAIHPLIKGGKTIKYSSYMLPIPVEAHHLPKICSNGCLIVGGAGLIMNPYNIDLSYLPMISGRLAANTIINAKSLNDYSEEIFSQYEKLIKEKMKEDTKCKQQLKKNSLLQDLDQIPNLT